MPDYRGTGGTLLGLGEFLQSLADANDPDKAKRKRLEQQLMTDPELAARLQQSPELLDSLVGNKNLFGKNQSQALKEKILNTALTPEQLARKSQQNSISNVMKFKNQDNINTSTDVANSINTGGLGTMIPKAPPLAPPTKQDQDIYNRFVGLPTTDEQEANTLNLQKLRGDVAKSTADTEHETQLRTAGAAARKYISENKTDPYSAFKNLKALPQDVQYGLLNDPGLKDAIQLGMTQEHYNTMEELQRLAQGSKHNERNLMQAASVASAQSISEKIGMPFEKVYAVMQSGKVGKPVDPNDPDAPVLEAINNFGSRYDKTQINKIVAQFNARKNAILNSKAAHDDPEGAVDRINMDAAMTFTNLGIAPPVFKYDKHFFSRNKTIVIDGGDPRLGFTTEEESKAKPESKSPDIDIDASVANVQSMIDDGLQSYEAAIKSSSLPPEVKAKLHKPKKK